MTSNTNRRWVLAVQYFLYFGVMGMHLPFFNLYCHEIGFSGWQIGTLSATRSVVLIIFGIGWSIAADRFRSRRTIYILCNFISAALWALFLLTAKFHWMMAITVVYGIFYAPLISFLEAFAMDLLGRDKKRYVGEWQFSSLRSPYCQGQTWLASGVISSSRAVIRAIMLSMTFVVGDVA